MTGVKKTHWLRNTLIVLIICGLAGTVLAAILFNADNNRTYASATIQFSFDGAGEGKAPNGYPFDVSGFFTDEVLTNALETSGLTGTYGAEQLRENLTVTGIYPEKIVEQMTKYMSLLDADGGNQAAVTDYRATQYNVRLYNDFDRSIDSGKLTELLENIMIAFRVYFIKTSASNLDTTSSIQGLSDYDYAQQLEAISENVMQLSRYAKEMAEMAPDFKVNRKGFDDIVVRYEALNSDINRLDATITFNAVSKDRDRLQKRYEMEIRTQTYQLESLTEELKLIEAQVNSYDKNGIIYVSANGSLSQVGNDQTGTYDKLVEKRKEVTDKIAGINAKIALYQSRLNDMTGATKKTEGAEEEDASAAEKLSTAEKAQLRENTEKKIQALTVKKDAVTTDFAAMLDAYKVREINEGTVSVTGLKYKTPSLLSAAFIKKVLMTAGPLCAAGFMVCMVLLIFSRRKEEKVAAGK